MKRVSVAVLAAALAVSGFAYHSFGDDSNKGSNQDQKQVDPAAGAGVETVSVAGNLAAWARQNKDPVELAAAARVLSNDPPTAMKDSEKEVKGDNKDKTGDTAKVELTPEALMKEAREMAKDNKEQLAAIDQIEKTMAQARGHVGGPIVDNDVLPAGCSVTYTLNFEGGQAMEVAVVSYGGSGLTYNVFDASGNQIYTLGGDHFVNMPKWTGAFKIVVANPTSSNLAYSLATN